MTTHVLIANSSRRRPLRLYRLRWAAVGVALLSAAAASASPTWVELGPAPVSTGSYSGRISAIVCSPTDANKFFVAGADGGIWRTTNGGATWTPLTDFMPTMAMGALAMDPWDEDVIYAGTGEANFANHSRYGLGLYKTLDGGNTWIHLAESAFAGRCFSRILIDPTNPQVLYASITTAGGFPALAAARGHPQASGPVGVFKSNDGGESWTQLTGGLPSLSATDIAIDPLNPQTLYAAIGHIFGSTSNGIYKSVNGGGNWTKLVGGLPTSSVGRITLAPSPSSPTVIYAVVTYAAGADGSGASTMNVYKTTNGGTSWSATNPGNFQASYGWYLSTAIVHPTNSNTVFVGGLDLLKTTNGGTNWSYVTPPHVDMHALAWDASGQLLCGNDGGVHRTANLGTSWTSHNVGLGCIQFYAGLSTSPANANYLYGGTQDNGSNWRGTDTLAWSQMLGGDGGCTGVRPANSNYVYAEWQGTGNLYRSTNYGSSMNAIGSGISSSDRNCFLPPFVINPASDAQMLYGTHRIYYSGNAGSSWTARSGDLSTGSGAIRCLVLAPSQPQTVYAVTNDGNVQVSTNFGTSWTLVRTGVPGWPRITRQIAVDPTDDQRAVLTVSYFGTDQLLLTTDRGASWTPIDGDLPDVPVNTAAIEHRQCQDVIYAGTDVGVYMTVNGGVNWRRLGANLPHAAVIDLVLDVPRNRLIAGTQGRGAWQIPLAPHGDFDGGGIELSDIPLFVEALLNPTPQAICIADMNGDSLLDGLDVQPFITALLES